MLCVLNELPRRKLQTRNSILVDQLLKQNIGERGGGTNVVKSACFIHHKIKLTTSCK